MLNPISCFISFSPLHLFFSLFYPFPLLPTLGAPNVRVARTPTMLPLSVKVVWLVFASLGMFSSFPLFHVLMRHHLLV